MCPTGFTAPDLGARGVFLDDDAHLAFGNAAKDINWYQFLKMSLDERCKMETNVATSPRVYLGLQQD